MHRQKTKFSNRVSGSRARSSEAASARPTSSTTGCFRTGEPASVRAGSPRAGRVQRRAVSDVDRGDRRPPVLELVGAETWSAVRGAGRPLRHGRPRTRSNRAARRHGHRPPPSRGQGVSRSRAQLRRRRLGLDDSWLAACISPRMLDVGRESAYLRLWPKLCTSDLWYSLPQPDATERVAPRSSGTATSRQAPAEGVPLLRDVDEGAGPSSTCRRASLEAVSRT